MSFTEEVVVELGSGTTKTVDVEFDAKLLQIKAYHPGNNYALTVSDIDDDNVALNGLTVSADTVYPVRVQAVDNANVSAGLGSFAERVYGPKIRVKVASGTSGDVIRVVLFGE